MDGWIKLQRSIQEHWIWQDPQKLKWWLDILLMANHKENKVVIGNEIKTIGRGEHLTSILKLSERWGVDRKTVRRFLLALERDGMVTVNGTTRGTTIKVSNYNTYQAFTKDERDNKRDNKVPTKSQQSPNERDTNKNDKNEKNEKKYICTFFDQLWEAYPRRLGKERISKESLKTINNIGYEKMAACIENYKMEIEKNHCSEEYIMYGSTFFNGRYKDYMEPVVSKGKKDGEWEVWV